jgi:CMP-N,N'-diacetyllegionaminic acid synthase
VSQTVDARPAVCALIPARGGSKGIPGKNIRLLAGRPLLAYSIEAARLAPAVGPVKHTTDDPDIGRVAEQHGAEVVWRPADISGDTASSESALLHALDWLSDAEGYEPDLVVFLQATSPLRRSGDVQGSIDLLLAEEADSLFSAFRASAFAWRVTASGVVPVNYDPARRPRRQEMTEELINENGSIYVFKPWVLRQHHSRLGGKIVAYMMDLLDSFEADEPADWSLLEGLSTLRHPSATNASG